MAARSRKKPAIAALVSAIALRRAIRYYRGPSRNRCRGITGGAMRPTKSRSLFTRFTKWTAHVTGRPITFALAVALILIWGGTGPMFHYSDTWQLVVNTATTVITFLMVFLIQST